MATAKFAAQLAIVATLMAWATDLHRVDLG